MFLNAILPMSGFHLMGLGHLHLLYILNVWSPTIYISPGHLAIYFLLFCFLSSMFLRSSTNTLIFSFFLPRFLLSFGIFKPTKLSVSYIQRAEEKIFDSYHSLLYGFL